LVFSALLPLAGIYSLFKMSFEQVKGKITRSAAISLALYTIFVYSTIIFEISSCAGGACFDNGRSRFLNGLAQMGFGFSMFMVVPLYCFLNAILFATKKTISTSLNSRIFIGVFWAFVIWLVGAFVLGSFGLNTGD